VGLEIDRSAVGSLQDFAWLVVFFMFVLIGFVMVRVSELT
jgi:hypothetical protein